MCLALLHSVKLSYCRHHSSAEGLRPKGLSFQCSEVTVLNSNNGVIRGHSCSCEEPAEAHCLSTTHFKFHKQRCVSSAF